MLGQLLGGWFEAALFVVGFGVVIMQLYQGGGSRSNAKEQVAALAEKEAEKVKAVKAAILAKGREERKAARAARKASAKPKNKKTHAITVKDARPERLLRAAPTSLPGGVVAQDAGTSPEQMAALATKLNAAAGASGEGLGGQLDISDLPFQTLPTSICDKLPGLQAMSCVAPGPAFDPSEVLARLPSLRTLAIKGKQPISRDCATAVFQHGGLHSLDLSQCRVLDINNAARGLCNANDIFERCHQSTAPLARLKLPEICTVEIGEVVKVFAKPKVVVIELYKPLALGDVILFRRVRRDSFGAVVTRGGHFWLSEKSTIDKIMTDDHTELQVADPPESLPRGLGFRVPGCVDRQFAIKVEQVGKKGDAVVWCGREPLNAEE